MIGMAMYYLFKMLKKIQPIAIKNSKVDKKSKIEAGSQFVNSSMDKYSFCGYNCTIMNTSIGAFCSIAGNVVVGLASHPTEWVSTSPAFYYGRDSIKKNLASKAYEPSPKHTTIGNDVWIGENVYVKGGVTIGDGAVVGFGSVVTKDIPPYEIWAGVPARFIRKRFIDSIANSLSESKWWEAPEDELKQLGEFIDDPNKFINCLQERNK